jgi:hypothetical protein
MKIGIVISGVIIVFFGAIIVVSLMGFPDEPTPQITAPGMMAKQFLPGDLPEIAHYGPGDAKPVYFQAFEMVQRAPGKFPIGEDPKEEDAAPLVDLLIRAMETGTVQAPFLDEVTPKSPAARCQYSDAIDRILASMQHHGDNIWKQGRKKEAVALGRAMWALGRQEFEKCVRLDNRIQGLTIMMEAGGKQLYNWSEKDEQLSADIDPWIYVEGRPIKDGPLHKIQDNWTPKISVVMALKPQIGDLLYIAEHDEDLSFRLEATYKLGIAKFAPRTRGNKRAIEHMIEKLKNSPEPQIAEAAARSANFTLDDLHHLN